MFKTLSHISNACCFEFQLCFKINIYNNVQNQYMKEIINRILNRKQTTQKQFYQVDNLKNKNVKKKKKKKKKRAQGPHCSPE